MERAKRIQCPAPLPEEPVILHLAKMLVPAPYTALAKKATGKAKGVRSGPRRKGASDATSEDKTRSSITKDDDDEEEKSDSPSDGWRKEEEGGLHDSGGGGPQEGERPSRGQLRMGHRQ